METLKATKRSLTSSGKINKLRSDGFIPAILYGGKKDNVSISLKKMILKDLITKETFLSKVIDLDIDGTPEKAIPRDIAYDPVSDEPIHIDFLRIVKGSKLVLEIPVKFINLDKSPGLKKGGVLNTVRRKVELKCPAETIPDEIILDLENIEIGSSLKISSVKLPENVTPVITSRDFVIATVVAPTIVVEPTKPEEAAAEGTAEGEAEGTTEAAPEGAEGAGKEDGKEKGAKPSGDKAKAAPADKNQTAAKETKKK